MVLVQKRLGSRKAGHICYLYLSLYYCHCFIHSSIIICVEVFTTSNLVTITHTSSSSFSSSSLHQYFSSDFFAWLPAEVQFIWAFINFLVLWLTYCPHFDDNILLWYIPVISIGILLQLYGRSHSIMKLFSFRILLTHGFQYLWFYNVYVKLNIIIC